MKMDLAPLMASAEPLARFVELLRRCPDDPTRKMLVVDAHLAGALTANECELLVSAMMLESA